MYQQNSEKALLGGGGGAGWQLPPPPPNNAFSAFSGYANDAHPEREAWLWGLLQPGPGREPVAPPLDLPLIFTHLVKLTMCICASTSNSGDNLGNIPYRTIWRRFNVDFEIIRKLLEWWIIEPLLAFYSFIKPYKNHTVANMLQRAVKSKLSIIYNDHCLCLFFHYFNIYS